MSITKPIFNVLNPIKRFTLDKNTSKSGTAPDSSAEKGLTSIHEAYILRIMRALPVRNIITFLVCTFIIPLNLTLTVEAKQLTLTVEAKQESSTKKPCIVTWIELTDSIAPISISGEYVTDTFQEGLKLIKKRQYNAAFAFLSPLVQQNDGGAMVLLASMHLRGCGCNEDFERGISLLQRAADSGFLPAYYYLTLLYIWHPQYKDFIKAEEIAKNATIKDNGYCCSRLFERWIREGAREEEILVILKCMLNLMRDDTMRSSSEIKENLRLLTGEGAQHHLLRQKIMGIISGYINSEIWAQETYLDILFFDKKYHECEEAALLLIQKETTTYPYFVLAHLYSESIPNKQQEAYDYATTGANKGCVRCLWLLIDMFSNPSKYAQLTKKTPNYEEAYKWLQVAADADSTYHAHILLSKFHIDGLGCEENLDVAAYWLEMAINGKSPYASEFIEELENRGRKEPKVREFLRIYELRSKGKKN